MKALIHVGSNKTGSTSIQESLYASRGELLEAGILYPDLKRRDHRDLVLCFKERPEKVKARKLGLTREQAVRLGESRAAALDSQLKQFSPRLCILSSEFFFGLEGVEVARFRDFLGERFSEYELLVYLREPDSLYCSFLQQRIKKAETPYVAPWEFKARNRERVERFVEVFGKERLMVVKFDPEILDGGDVVQDLLARVGYVGKVTRSRANEAMPAELVSLLARYDSQTVGMKKGSHEHRAEFMRKYKHLKSVGTACRGPEGMPSLSLPKEQWVEVLRSNHNSEATWLNDTFYQGEAVFRTTEREFNARELEGFSYQEFLDWLSGYKYEDLSMLVIDALLEEVIGRKVGVRREMKRIWRSMRR